MAILLLLFSKVTEGGGVSVWQCQNVELQRPEEIREELRPIV